MKTASKKAPKKAPYMARQGDVLLVAVSAAVTLADAFAPATRDGGRVILAYGEVTGHAHAIRESRVALLEIGDKAAMANAARELLASVGLTTEIRDEEVVGVLEVDEPAALAHDEHAPIALRAGERYVVLRQREYSPEAIQTVAD